MDILTFGLVIGTIILLTVKVIQQQISIRTLVWPYIILIVMFFVINPPVLRYLTHLFGFDATENFIFFIITGYLFLMTIIQELRIAKLNDQISGLVRTVGILEKEQDDSNNSSN